MLGILRSVDIGKGAIAHLLDELPAFEARISRQLAFAFALLGNDALKNRRVVVFLLLVLLLLGIRSARGGMACFGGDISVVHGGGGIVLFLGRGGLKGLVLVDIRIAHAHVLGLGVVAGMALVESLLLGVDIGNVCGGLVLRRAGVSRLLPVTDEVFEVLYGRHG